MWILISKEDEIDCVYRFGDFDYRISMKNVTLYKYTRVLNAIFSLPELTILNSTTILSLELEDTNKTRYMPEFYAATFLKKIVDRGIKDHVLLNKIISEIITWVCIIMFFLCIWIKCLMNF